MKWINRRKFTAVSLTAIIIVACLLPSAHAGPSVTVVNTNAAVIVNTMANPVPVTLQGSSTVSGSVSITGTPTVNVASTTNTPLLVRDVDRPGRLASYADTAGSPFGTEFDAVPSFKAVPAGKVLVVEYVSAIATLGSGENITRFALTWGGNTHYFPMNHQGQFNDGNETFIASQPIRFSVGATDGLAVLVGRNVATNSTDEILASISGYLVDAP
jgi:hypothetical protein